MSERGARHQAAHAVADERHRVAAVGGDTFRERAAERRDVAPPVVVEQHRIEAGLAQAERELEIAVAHRAQCHDARSVVQPQLGQAPEGDVDGIQPQDVIRALAAADETELRTHDAGQHVDAAPWRGPGLALARRGAGQRRELRVQRLAEVFDQSRVRRPRCQQRNERAFVEREAIVRRDVIGGRARSVGGAQGESPSLPSIQSSTGRHRVSRCREAKNPSWPMRFDAASAGEYQRDSRAAFG